MESDGLFDNNNNTSKTFKDTEYLNVINGENISKHIISNKRETLNKATAHAEVLAIEKASKKLNSWRLEDCTMYITLEPCVMCSGAIIQSRIDEVIYGAKDNRFGVHDSITNIFNLKFNHSVSIKNKVLENECSSIISDFFKKLRETK